MSEEKRNPDCIIDHLPGDTRAGAIMCHECDCSSCGWNVEVDRARKWYIRRFGLKKGKDGLRRLIIRK